MSSHMYLCRNINTKRDFKKSTSQLNSFRNLPQFLSVILIQKQACRKGTCRSISVGSTHILGALKFGAFDQWFVHGIFKKLMTSLSGVMATLLKRRHPTIQDKELVASLDRCQRRTSNSTWKGSSGRRRSYLHGFAFDRQGGQSWPDETRLYPIHDGSNQ